MADGLLDGFWANGMGAEVAVRRGVGTIVIDTRRGDGPEPSWHYTFPALVTRADVPDDQAAAAVRALVRAQALLRQDPSRATQVAERVFPAMEAGLIAELIRRDVPYYDAAISRETFDTLNRFAADMDLLHTTPVYEEVVAAELAPLWAVA